MNLKEDDKMKMSHSQIDDLFFKQKSYFNSGSTQNIQFRKKALLKLLKSIQRYEKEIQAALYADLKKSTEEAFLTEIGIVTKEIRYHLTHLDSWAKPLKIQTPLPLFPSKSFKLFQPLGVVLIISPWNYPFQLVISPLIGAISSGCCAILKPSEFTPATAKILDKIIIESFQPEHIGIVHGDHETGQFLIEHKFDKIFFTGSSAVGKTIMMEAAKNLVPVTLELGGKSPCVIDKSANLEIAAKRIAWAKGLNCGQTCIAPDYLIVDEKVQHRLIELLIDSFKEIYGDDIQGSKYYPRIIHNKAFLRLKTMIEKGNVYWGGEMNEEEKYISPTLLYPVDLNEPCMQEEIFGPVLPIITTRDIDEAIAFINSRERPLALYVFSDSATGNKVLSKTISGGACVNDLLMHIANNELGLGGVGNSGIGSYHGKKSFETFGHEKSIVKTPTLIDLPFRYPPFKMYSIIKKLFS